MLLFKEDREFRNKERKFSTNDSLLFISNNNSKEPKLLVTGHTKIIHDKINYMKVSQSIIKGIIIKELKEIYHF